MARAIWSGSISFGLVNIPVKLYSAISEKSVRFNQLDKRNGARVRQLRINEIDGTEVPYDQIVKGYEISKGTYVTVDESEIADLLPEATHTIDLECFVGLDEIDPVFFDGAYYVAPEKAAKPYRLLVDAMERSGKVAIAKFVMRSKQHVAVLRPRDGTLVLSMMVYADELNDAGEIPELDAVGAVELDDRELAMADQLIASLSEDFDPASYHDTYRTQVLDLIERKAAGEQLTPAVTAAPSGDRVVDLMAALEASVAAAKSSRRRHPTAGADDATTPPGDADAGDASAPVRRSPARRKSA